MIDHPQLLELAELYALGGLSPSERAELVEHVADGCGECEAVLRANSRLADELLLAIAPVQPSSGVRAGLLERARSDSNPTVLRTPARGGARAGWRTPLAAAAGIALVLGLGTTSGVLWSRLARESAARADVEDALHYQQDISSSLLSQAKAEREERVALEERLAGASRIVAAIGAPLVRTLALAGQGEFRAALAKAYVDPDSGRLIVYAHNLPPVPDGRTYQLWVIVDKQPRRVGTLQADAQGEAKYDTGPLSGLAGRVSVAVTLEPDGAVERPTGPLVLSEG
ncbi:MAG TPA: anti-sigma factor [Myxococcota bacterium]|nr:anti-sigma factor [Myxococcota bacterium]